MLASTVLWVLGVLVRWCGPRWGVAGGEDGGGVWW